MDPAKKTVIEQRVVIGLAGVFVVALCAGPLRSLGWFTRKAAAIGAGELRQRTEPEAKTQEPAPVAAGGALYTAQHLRDPLASLLPQRPAVVSAAPVPAAGEQPRPGSAAPNAAQSLLPPVLRVQGLVWGEAEPKAIIDGRIYDVDDQVGGGTIVGIDHRGVVLEFQGKLLAYQPSSSTRPSVVSDPYRSGGMNQGR